jgi:beta-phosphoglucomutase-like phosphatase (HAD superfamily)
VLRAVLFELNGVLVDDEPIHAETFARVLAEEGMATIAREAGEAGLDSLGRDDRSRFAAALAAAGEQATVPRLMRLTARKSAYYRERIRAGGYPLVPGAADLVRELAAARRMLGVVTGALLDEVEDALRQSGLRAHFKVLITAEDVSEGKPDPEGHLRALEGMSSIPPLPERLIHPHEVLAVEHGPAGLAAAAEVGLLTLAVGAGERRDVHDADAVVDDLSGMTLERLERLFADVSRR